MAESKQSVISNRNLAVLGHVMGLTYYVAIDAHKIDWGKGALQEASHSLHPSPSQCLGSAYPCIDSNFTLQMCALCGYKRQGYDNMILGFLIKKG